MDGDDDAAPAGGIGLQCLQDGVLVVQVQAGDGFVCQQDARLSGQYAGEPDAGAFAAGKFPHAATAQRTRAGLRQRRIDGGGVLIVPRQAAKAHDVFDA